MPHPTQNMTLKRKIFWHLTLILGAVVISLIFSLILRRQFTHPQLPSMLFLTFLQLELFVWLGTLFFQSVKIDEAGYVRRVVVRLLVFYLTVLVVAMLMFLAIYTYHFIKDGAEFAYYLESLMNLELKSFFIATLVGFAFGAIFFFYTQWSEALQRMHKLKEEKLIFQYETLKNQVNPHFLFNSLNTLSSLIRSDVDLSDLFIQKLSSVYRYVLENQENELVPLEEELQFVRDYFYLQQIRDGEKIELKMEVQNTVGASILPVSLQLLVENALKHNTATRRDPLWITIHYEGMDKMVVRNDLREKTQLNNSSKIGLKNLNERSKLILGREIEVQNTPDEFVVKVPLKLNENCL